MQRLWKIVSKADFLQVSIVTVLLYAIISQTMDMSCDVEQTLEVTESHWQWRHTKLHKHLHVRHNSTVCRPGYAKA